MQVEPRETILYSNPGHRLKPDRLCSASCLPAPGPKLSTFLSLSLSHTTDHEEEHNPPASVFFTICLVLCVQDFCCYSWEVTQVAESPSWFLTSLPGQHHQQLPFIEGVLCAEHCSKDFLHLHNLFIKDNVEILVRFIASLLLTLRVRLTKLSLCFLPPKNRYPSLQQGQSEMSPMRSALPHRAKAMRQTDLSHPRIFKTSRALPVPHPARAERGAVLPGDGGSPLPGCAAHPQTISSQTKGPSLKS